MQIQVRLFAALREIVGTADFTHDAPPGATARTVWSALASAHPALVPYETVSSCAVNAEYAPFDATLKENDEVAFLPPVSGG